MADLAEFLLARIAEDEEAARSATRGPWAVQNLAENLVYGDPAVGVFVADTGRPSSDARVLSDAAHIARHNPARVLAECEAKRRIIELHTNESLADGTCRECSHDGDYESDWVDIPCPTLRALALSV